MKIGGHNLFELLIKLRLRLNSDKESLFSDVHKLLDFEQTENPKIF
jgi:hypothetical protein